MSVDHAAVDAPEVPLGMVRSRRRVPTLPLGVVAAALVIWLAGSLFQDQDFFPAMVSAGIWSSVAIGLGLLVGRAGQVSLGQGAVAAAAAYGAGYAISEWGWGFPFSLFAAVAIAVALALVSSPILRVRGFYFALATLAAAIVVERLIVAWKGITGGPNGLGGIERLTIFGYEFRTDLSFFYLSWGTVVVGAVVIRLLVDSRFGRALSALSHDEDMASTVGIPVARYKAWVWVISAVYAAVGATLFTYYNRFLTPEQFDLERSIILIAAVIAGGAATVVGPSVGLLAILVLPQVIHVVEGQTEIIVGGLLVGTALFAPNGILPHGASLLRRLRRGAATTPETMAAAAPTSASGGGADARPDADPSDGVVAQPTRSHRRVATEGRAGTSLRIEGLRKRFGGLSVLEDVHLDVEAGSIQGIIGPNGAGKTSLINCVTGLLRPDDGQVWLGDTNITRQAPDRLCRAGLVRTFQHTRLLGDHTALENVLLGTHTRGRVAPAAGIVRTPGFRHEERRLLEEAVACLDDLGIGHLADTPAAYLAAGQQRLVAIARALAARPSVLLLDEPAAGLNESEVAQLGADLRLVRDAGTTIVIIEHHLDLIMSLCDRVAVLNDGTMIADDVPTVIQKDPRVIEAYLGVDA